MPPPLLPPPLLLPSPPFPLPLSAFFFFFFFCDVIFSLSSHSLLFPEAVSGMNASLFLSLRCFPKVRYWMWMLSSFTLCLTFSVHMEEEVGGGGHVWANYALCNYTFHFEYVLTEFHS